MRFAKKRVDQSKEGWVSKGSHISHPRSLPHLVFSRWRRAAPRRALKTTRRIDPWGRGSRGGPGRARFLAPPPSIAVAALLEPIWADGTLPQATKNPPNRRVAQSSHRDVSHGRSHQPRGGLRETPFPLKSVSAPPRQRNGICSGPARCSAIYFDHFHRLTRSHQPRFWV